MRLLALVRDELAGVQVASPARGKHVSAGVCDRQDLADLPLEGIGTGVATVDNGDYLAAQNLQDALTIDQYSGSSW